MLFRLAGHLGWPSVAWGASRMTASELAEWEVFARLEPFGPAREDLRFGLIASMLSTKGRPQDFFPNLRADGSADASPEDDWAAMKRIGELFGAVKPEDFKRKE